MDDARGATLAPLSAGDISGLHALEADCYEPALHESDAAFLRLIELCPAGAIGAFDGAGLCGYAFGVPLESGTVLTLRQPLVTIPADARIFYVHDVGVAPRQRGRGVGTALGRALLEAGLALGFRAFELVSVQGSVPFWSRLGFREIARIEYAGVPGLRMRADV